MATPSQFFFGPVHTPWLHHWLASQPWSDSHFVSMASSEKHVAFLHVPDWHSASASHVAPFSFFACLQPGKSGGQSPPPPPAHGFGAGLPGRCGGSPPASVLMVTFSGAFFVPFVAMTSPPGPIAWM